MLRRRRAERRARDQVEMVSPSEAGAPADLAELPDWLVLVAPDSAAASSAVQAAHRIMESVPGSGLARLDRDARLWPEREGQGWWSLRADDVPVLAQATGARVAVGVVASVHRDGYVRAAGVRVLARQWSEGELRWLLLRTGDVVAEIRELAVQAVRMRAFGPSKAEYLAPLAMEVAFVAGGRIASHPEGALLRDELRAALRDRGSYFLREAAQSADRLTRRSAVELLIGVEPPIDLLASQLSGVDLFALTMAARAALATDQAPTAARLLLDTPWVSIRELAFSSLGAGGGVGGALVERGLRDPSARVRAMAQRAAEAAGVDVANWYRSQVGTSSFVALLGLGDIGGTEDAQLAELFVTARRSEVRAAAIRVLAQKGGSGYVDVLAAALDDNSRVATHALRGLVRRGISDEQAGRLWAQAKDNHRATAATRVLDQLVPPSSRWMALRCGLEALSEPEPAVVASGLDLLRRTWSVWDRSASEAAPGEREALGVLLDEAGPVLAKADKSLLNSYWLVVRGAASPEYEPGTGTEHPVAPEAETGRELGTGPEPEAGIGAEGVNAEAGHAPEVAEAVPAAPADAPEAPNVPVPEPEAASMGAEVPTPPRETAMAWVEAPDGVPEVPEAPALGDGPAAPTGVAEPPPALPAEVGEAPAAPDLAERPELSELPEPPEIPEPELAPVAEARPPSERSKGWFRPGRRS